jgi:pseudouridine-5'-phosphate glycosidase
MNPALIAIAPEVAASLAAGRPVVALESTIIAHGMPWPENVDTAHAVEAIVREAGAVPATIAVIGGKVRVGLSPDELTMLARTNDVLKLSRADLPYALTTGRTGATTIAATMICAALAGIRVFGTGGLGGVHRGAETTFDIPPT